MIEDTDSIAIYGEHGGYLGQFYFSFYDFFSSKDKNLFLKRLELAHDKNKILFIHLAKTAGSSIINHFGEYYYSYHPPSLYSKLAVERNTFIRSHVKRSSLEDFNLSDASKITFFRNPKDRIISLYYYSRYNNMHEFPDSLDLLGYLKSRNGFVGEGNFDFYIDNIYTRYFTSRNIKTGDEIRKSDVDEALKYIKTLDFIGITENFDEDLDRLSDYYYMPKPQKKIIANSFKQNNIVYEKRTKKKMEREAIAPEIERELDRLTKYDYIIYNAAKKIRDEQVKKWKAGEMKRAMGD